MSVTHTRPGVPPGGHVTLTGWPLRPRYATALVLQSVPVAAGAPPPPRLLQASRPEPPSAANASANAARPTGAAAETRAVSFSARGNALTTSFAIFIPSL